MTKYFLVVALCASCLACGRKGTPARSESVSAAAASAGASGLTASADTAGLSASSKKKAECPATGNWAPCSVEKRLKQSGFVVIRDSVATATRAGFSGRPLIYKLGRGHLEVFLYPDASAANHIVAGLDTVKAAPRGGSNSWETTPVFVRSANLLAVFLTDDPRQAERLSLALTAGAPQPAGVMTLKPSISTPSSPR